MILFQVTLKYPKTANCKDYNRPSVKDITQRSASPDKFPSVYEIGEKNFFELLKKEFDIIHKEYSSIKTADDDIALFSIDRLKHIFEKKWKKMQCYLY